MNKIHAMKKTAFENVLEDSASMLQIASNELNRPFEDTVTRCVCQCTRNAVIGFLQAYLIEKKASRVANNSIENLLSVCAGIDPDFKNLDIHCFLCKSLEEDSISGYCLAHEKVSECYSCAKTIEEFVRQKLIN